MTATDLPLPESQDPKLNRLVAAQLCKTKMCAMFARGSCTDPKCKFAHSTSELRHQPDLTKTAICRAFARGQCRDRNCKFAHGEQELRVTPSVYKTQLCNFFERGHCKKGDRCRHAHGATELRSFQAAKGPSAGVAATASNASTSSGNSSPPVGSPIPRRELVDPTSTPTRALDMGYGGVSPMQSVLSPPSRARTGGLDETPMPFDLMTNLWWAGVHSPHALQQQAHQQPTRMLDPCDVLVNARSKPRQRNFAPETPKAGTEPMKVQLPRPAGEGLLARGVDLSDFIAPMPRTLNFADEPSPLCAASGRSCLGSWSTETATWVV